MIVPSLALALALALALTLALRAAHPARRSLRFALHSCEDLEWRVVLDGRSASWLACEAHAAAVRLTEHALAIGKATRKAPFARAREFPIDGELEISGSRKPPWPVRFVVRACLCA